MREHPILFKPWLVSRILEGRKTQTRRDHALRAGVGDILWVRESMWSYGIWEVNEDGKKWHAADRCWRHVADCPEKPTDNPVELFGGHWRMVPNIHVPRSQCRLRLRVTRVWEERLLLISEEDAIAEGVESMLGKFAGDHKMVWKDYSSGVFDLWTARASYLSLWDSINGADASKSDPVVHCYEFEIVKG